ncbi:MAG: TerD family protein [Alphaproteobacteria bacterium]
MVDIFDKSVENVEIEVSDNKISKGQEVNLRELDPTMTKVVIGLGWKLNAFDTDSLDLDVSCFLLNTEDKTRMDNDFVFYNNLEACDGAVVHNGDNLTGAGDGDDETISIDLNGVPFDIQKIMFVLSIYKGEEKDQNMSKVRNGYIRLLNADNGDQMVRYELNDEVQGRPETGMLVASLNREGPKWHFHAAGEFVQGGLAKIATDYDIIVHTG